METGWWIHIWSVFKNFRVELVMLACSFGILPLKFYTRFFHTCKACRHHWPVASYTTFGDIDHGWGRRSVESIECWPCFLAHFSTDQDEDWCSIESVWNQNLWLQLIKMRTDAVLNKFRITVRLGEIASVMCNFSLSVAACTMVWGGLFLGDTLQYMLLGHKATPKTSILLELLQPRADITSL